MINPSEYTTITNAAKALGCRRSVVWNRIYRKRIPYIIIGNSAIVRFEDVKGVNRQEKKA